MQKTYHHQNLAILIIVTNVSSQFQINVLQESNKYKQLLFHSCSHELRTPLNCINSLISCAVGDKDFTNEMKNNLIYPIYYSGKQLCNLINDMLDYSLIVSNDFKLEISRFCLYDKLLEVMEIFRLQATAKNIKLILDIDWELYFTKFIASDEQRISQILCQLLSNGIKFQQFGSLKLTVKQLKNSDDIIKFSVKDEGVGMNEYEQKILQRQMDEIGNNLQKVSLGSTGASLGLMVSCAISRMLRQESKGIQFKSEEDKGSKFFFHVRNRIPKFQNMSNNFQKIKSNGSRSSVNWDKDKKYIKSYSIGYLDQKNLYNNNNQQQISFIARQKSQDFTYGGSSRVMVTFKQDIATQRTEKKRNLSVLNMDLQKQQEKSPISVKFTCREFEHNGICIRITKRKQILKSLKFYSEQQWDNQIYFSSVSSMTDQHKVDSINGVKHKEKDSDRSASNQQSSLRNSFENENEMSSGEQLEHQQQQITFNPLKQMKLMNDFQTSWTPLEFYRKQNPSTSILSANQWESATKFYPLSDNSDLPPCIHPKILIVDDDMFNILALQQILKQKNLQSSFANNGQQAIKIIIDEQDKRKECTCKNFQLIFMDLNMPIMDGIEATKQLLALMKQKTIQKITIVGCSAYGQEKNNCIQLGMDSFLTKPLTAKIVQETIKKYLI